MATGDLARIRQALPGWTDPAAALREAGVKVDGFGDLVLDHVNETLRLSLECHEAESYLRAHILDKETEAGFTLVIEYGDKLDPVLATFARWQDTVNDETFRTLVSDLVKTKARVLAETDEGLAEIDVEE